MQSIPFPPKTIPEALHRCPIDRDTLVDSATKEIDRYIAEPQSKRLLNSSPSKLTARELQAKKKLNKEILQSKNSISRLLANAADSSAKELLDQVRIIGEELDSIIKNCATGKAVSDSECVNVAEHQALMKRREVSFDFIRHVRSSWGGMIDSLKIIFDTRTKLAEQVSTTESQEQNHELWKIVREVLEKEEQITKLVVQFSR